MLRSTTIAALVMFAGTAAGQSFNIDLNGTSGHGSGVPASTFGAAAGQPGTWNNITNGSAATVSLARTNGSPSGVTMTWDKSTAITGIYDADPTGETAKMLLDGQFMSSWGTLNYTFSNLEAGTYAVFTYTGRPADTQEAGVSVVGSSSAYQYVGGNMTNALMPGVSHAVHVVTVAAGGSFQVKVNDSMFGNAGCSAIQIRKIDSSRLRFYVNKNQNSNPHTGASWTNAYNDLQPILKQTALIGGAHCEIWVRSAFYYPTTGIDRTQSFVIPSGLHLYGGFGGTETSLAERLYPWFWITALSGSIGTSSINDNTYQVVNAANTSNATILDGFTISNGRATGSGNYSRGGGMYAPSSRIRVANCKFISNSAAIDGGGVYSSDFPNFTNCLFYKNDSSGAGGGLYHTTTGSPTLYNTSFIGNTSTGDGAGAKISFADGYFFGCLFSGNTASSSHGGAISAAGNSGDDVRLVNCTLASNVSGTNAGGVYANNSTKVYLDNCILWGNTDQYSNNAVDRQYGTNSLAQIIRASTTVQGLHADPLFVNAKGNDGVAGTTDDNCRLQTNSPCIDAGDNSLLPWDFGDADGDGFLFEYYPFDLDGNARVVDVPWAGGTGVDRGAYEYQYSTCPADFDKSGFVDLDDYIAFVAAFEAGTDDADFDGTGFVDTDDFTAFVLAFQEGC